MQLSFLKKALLCKNHFLETDRQTEHIIEGCRSNKRSAQKALYEAYCDAMFSTACRIVNNYDDAQDVLQDAFLEIFSHISQFRGESTIGAWIKTIVVRKALKKLKSLKFNDIFEENGSETTLDFMNDFSGEYLEQLILSLPDGYRAVFLLIEIEGYNHGEVAAMLGISAGTSKSQLSRAKKFLRAKVDKINAF